MKQAEPAADSILVVDDVPLNLDVIVEYLIDAGFEIFVASTGEEALEQLDIVDPDLILLDVMLPGLDGFEVCERIQSNSKTQEIPVIFMTALSEIADKVRGFEVGGVDYITKPIQREEMLARVNTHLELKKARQALREANENLEQRVTERTAELRSALDRVEQLTARLQAENAYLQEEIKAEHNFHEVIGSSEALNRVLQDVQEVAPTDTTVLILGETGTGKEVIARSLHNTSLRQDKAFIKVNCAAIPENLVESEFFGHEKGAFTGAVAKRDGRFTLAHGGTIFLDEIGELQLDMQSKLLRVLQEGEFDPVGSSKTRKVDVRVIAATHRNLQQAVADGEFREDLYYRISVFPIDIPALRDRGDDIVLLAAFFAEQCAKKLGKSIAPISEIQARRLLDYAWPGNIRELQNVIERAAITASAGRLNLDRALPETADSKKTVTAPPVDAEPANIFTVKEMEKLERENIIRALEASDWRVAGAKGAAAILQIKPTTLNSRIKAFGIQRPQR